jgi:hypothetical protein
MPRLDERMIAKLETLVDRYLKLGANKNAENQLTAIEDRSACRAWIASAVHAVQNICPPSNAYRVSIEKTAESQVADGLAVYKSVVQIATIVQELLLDAKNGLLVSLGDVVRAETFAEFLDHGRAYFKEQRKMESGVIIGVVFEDALRRICDKRQIPQIDRKLDDLISDLTKAGVLSGAQPKRARVAAHVRTKATHAQWNEFELSDVQDALAITEEVVETHLS